MIEKKIETDPVDKLAVVRHYYNGCTSGDLDQLEKTLHPGVVHYFLKPNAGFAPVFGREHLARYWRKVARMIDARWIVDHAITSGTEVVIEWTMFWRPKHGRERIATRGAEWFVFKDGLISEIRSYYQQREHTTELDAFPYDARGYSVKGVERSRLHPDADNYRAIIGEGLSS